MRSRLCCPCAGVLRQPERISHRQCCHSSGKRIGHGSGLWYRWPTPKTPGSRQVVPISNAALPAPLAAFKSPDGEQDRRGDEGSCGSRLVDPAGYFGSSQRTETRRKGCKCYSFALGSRAEASDALLRSFQRPEAADIGRGHLPACCGAAGRPAESPCSAGGIMFERRPMAQ